MHDEAKLIKDKNGNPIETIGSWIDITESKNAEVKLKESEKRYKHLANELEMILDHIPGIVVYKDTENNILRVNKFLADAHNLSKEEMEGKSSFDLYPKEQAQAYWDDDLEVINSREPKLDFIEPWEPEKGKRWVNTSKIPYIDEEGNVKGIIAIASDITEMKIAEEKLKESEERFRSIFENAPVGIAQVAPDGSFIRINQRFCDILKYSQEEMLSITFQEITHPNDLEENLIAKNKLLKGEISTYITEKRYICKDGPPVWVNLTVALLQDSLGNPQHFISIMEDISDKKKAEDELRLHSKIMKNMAEGVCLTRTDDAIFVYTNPRFEKMFGYKPGEMRGKHVSIINAPTDKSPEETAKEILEILERTGEWHGEVNNIKKDGTLLLCYANISIFNHPEYGKVHVSVTADITERKKAEDELKESEQLYRLLYESSHDGIVRTNMEGKILECNQAYADMVGYTIEELKELTYQQLTPKKWHEMEEKIVKNQFIARGYSEEYEKEYIKKNGKVFPVALKGSILRDKNGKPIEMQGYVRDITMRKKTEKKMRDLAKFPSENPNPVLRVNKKIILYSNKAGVEIFNISEGEDIPENLGGIRREK